MSGSTDISLLIPPKASATALRTPSGSPDPTTRDALAIFSRTAPSESRVHGVCEDELHLHELGQADAIADVAGASAAIHDLTPSAIFCARIVAGI
ncbi:MAG TPA: DUF111 family protein [Ectothiorhodospiraceae bacterium]|nr:MAG: hypothetical protein DRO03_03800 [Methanosarcinales archaeon]HEA26429.1 DUF111 family protein [Ectothiorhodospiraceae bacterium]